MPGLGAHEQVRRGLPRAPLLRRLRVGGRLRAARDRPRQGAVRRRARERPAALGRPGQHGGLPRPAPAGREDHGPVARTRRAPHPRHADQRLRAAVRDRRLRGRPREQPDRHGRGRADRARGETEAAARRLVGLSARARLRPLPADRRRGRRAADGGHGALRRARRGGAPPEPGRLRRRRRHDHDPQDPRRSPRGDHPLQAGVREEDRLGRLPGSAGRPARARDSGQGVRDEGRGKRALRRAPAAHDRRGAGARGGAAHGRLTA